MRRFVMVVLGVGLLAGSGARAETPAQRGYEVYQQVCSACHGMRSVTYADLTGLGFTPREIRDFAATHRVPDGLDEDGELRTRPATPADHMLSPYANETMARAANHGHLPPDLSRRALTQSGGAAWIARMLQSYPADPPDHPLPPGLYYNTATRSGRIEMPQPLHTGQVLYHDSTTASVAQMAGDVSAYLDWAAHPHLSQRHRIGVFVLGYLALMAVLCLILHRRVRARFSGRG